MNKFFVSGRLVARLLHARRGFHVIVKLHMTKDPKCRNSSSNPCLPISELAKQNVTSRRAHHTFTTSSTRHIEKLRLSTTFQDPSAISKFVAQQCTLQTLHTSSSMAPKSLKVWLADYIWEEISHVITWKHDTSKGIKTEPDGRFNDDGSNFRCVSLPPEGSDVQLTLCPAVS